MEKGKKRETHNTRHQYQQAVYNQRSQIIENACLKIQTSILSFSILQKSLSTLYITSQNLSPFPINICAHAATYLILSTQIYFFHLSLLQSCPSPTQYHVQALGSSPLYIIKLGVFLHAHAMQSCFFLGIGFVWIASFIIKEQSSKQKTKNDSAIRNIQNTYKNELRD